jgi:putative alpha-1,2-mannosidase
MVGNDDSGGMSSWYVWSALGIFPVAGQDVFLIGTPLFNRAEVQFGPEQAFTIKTSGGGSESPYVATVLLNGKPLGQPFLQWKDLCLGGTLSVEMTPTPSVWTKERPPSIV